MNSNGRAPTTVETWPGPTKPSSRRSGESSSARSGGTIVTWLHMHEQDISLRSDPPEGEGPKADAVDSVAYLRGLVGGST